jgi:hypothetical protein
MPEISTRVSRTLNLLFPGGCFLHRGRIWPWSYIYFINSWSWTAIQHPHSKTQTTLS